MSTSPYAAALRAALEAGAVAAAACGAIAFAPWPVDVRRGACWGVVLAWAACTAGTAILAFGLKAGQKTFWRAFGAGVALRVVVLAGLMAATWSKTPHEAAAWLGAYVLALAGMMLVEFRHLIRRER